MIGGLLSHAEISAPPQREGFTLNVEGRRAAGLDPHSSRALNVYSQSKGRTPSVFVFNPFAEGRIAEGKAFNPTKPQAQLARDLENLPQFLCRQDDIVLVKHRPSVEFLSAIKQAGFHCRSLWRWAGAPISNRRVGASRPEPGHIESGSGLQRANSAAFAHGRGRQTVWNCSRRSLAASPPRNAPPSSASTKPSRNFTPKRGVRTC